uniref:Uncharacterized protein n=1 Tax=Homalodisca liturata TaxID=320908 RepID=A0A1B6HEW1_9HEMI
MRVLLFLITRSLNVHFHLVERDLLQRGCVIDIVPVEYGLIEDRCKESTQTRPKPVNPVAPPLPIPQSRPQTSDRVHTRSSVWSHSNREGEDGAAKLERCRVGFVGVARIFTGTHYHHEETGGEELHSDRLHVRESCVRNCAAQTHACRHGRAEHVLRRQEHKQTESQDSAHNLREDVDYRQSRRYLAQYHEGYRHCRVQVRCAYVSKYLNDGSNNDGEDDGALKGMERDVFHEGDTAHTSKKEQHSSANSFSEENLHQLPVNGITSSRLHVHGRLSPSRHVFSRSLLTLLISYHYYDGHPRAL